MLNPSDKELDDLSREAAERFEVDENISSWEKLSAGLDTELGTQGPRYSQRQNAKRVLYSLFLLLLLSMGYLVFGPSKHSNGSAKTNLNSVAADAANGKTANTSKNSNIPSEEGAGSANSKKNIKSLETPTDNSLSRTSTESAVKSESTTSAPLANPGSLVKTKPAEIHSKENIKDRLSGNSNNGLSQGEANRKENAAGNQRNLLNTNSANRSALKSRQNQTADLFTPDNSNSGNSHKGTSISEKELSLSTVEAPGNLTETGLYTINATPLPALTLKTSEAVTPSASAKIVKHKNPRTRPLTIGLMFAPDVSNVNSFRDNKASANLGITLGYHLSERLSVNSGLTITKKNYAAEGKDFHPTNTWLNITGNCSMFEIPLTLRYDISVNKKSRFFVNGGLSTYLMKTEEYYYDYRYGSVTYHKDSSYDSHERNYLSIVNFSAGFEHSLSNNLSLQVEPFVKIPLTGVGIGKLQLNSYGVSFSLRWSPVLKK